MVGDSLPVDIAGAQEAGWDTVYFNPGKIPHEENPTHEVASLDLLKNIL